MVKKDRHSARSVTSNRHGEALRINGKRNPTTKGRGVKCDG
jgi:hypothetical protein